MASYEYKSKTDLIQVIHKSYLLLDEEFEGIDNSDKDMAIPEVDKTPAQIIAYQLGWLNLVKAWDRDEKAGREVIMPAPGFKWNQLGEMYRSFYETYADCSLDELRRLFRAVVEEWISWIDSLSEDELFTQGARSWTGNKPNWPLARWIHINSAAPFKSFRAKLRKWKKYRASTGR